MTRAPVNIREFPSLHQAVNGVLHLRISCLSELHLYYYLHAIIHISLLLGDYACVGEVSYLGD